MIKTEPFDCRRCREGTFEKWMATHKFTWDKNLGGRVIVTVNSTIQHGEFGTLPVAEAPSIQHGERTTHPASETPPISSPRLAFRQQVSLNPSTLAPCSSSSATSPFSSSASADSISEPSLFTTDFFEVLKSPKGGYGAFALKDIEIGTVILSEKPLFKAHALSVYYEHEKLSREQRREYAALYGYKGLSSDPRMAIFMTNRFEINSTTGGIFIKSSRFNHACPEFKTCSYSYRESEDRLVTTACRQIKKGQEITIAYDRYPNDLYKNYGFRCDCPACPDPKAAERNERLMSAGY